MSLSVAECVCILDTIGILYKNARIKAYKRFAAVSPNVCYAALPFCDGLVI